MRGSGQIVYKRGINVVTLVLCLAVIMGYGCSSKLYIHPLSVNPKAESTAEVIFFRESTAIGALVGLPVYLNNKPLVTLRNGTFVKVYLTPGTYMMRVGEFREKGGFTAAVRKAHFARNRTYYILLQPGHEGDYSAFLPSLLNDAQAKSLRIKLKPFGEETLNADRFHGKLDPSSSVLDRAEWLAEDLEAVEEGVTFPPFLESMSNELAELTPKLSAYLEANPRDIRARILFARLGRVSTTIQPIILGQPVVPGHEASEVDAILARSLAALNQAMALAPENAEAHYWKARLSGIKMPVEREGRLFYEVRDLQAAIQSSRKSVELSPGNVTYREAYALYLIENNQFDEAMKVMREVAGGRNPIHQLLEDWQLLPIPEHGFVSQQDAQSFAEQQMTQGRFSDYPILRVRFIVLLMTSDEVADFYRQRWPGFKFKLQDREKLKPGGEMLLFGSYLLKRNGLLQPTSSVPDRPSESKDGIFLSLTEFRGVPPEFPRETPAGYKFSIEAETFCYMVVVNYSSYESGG